MITIKLTPPHKPSIEFTAQTFDEGLAEARIKHKKLGLIGNYYVVGSDGQIRLIN
jgi:hypothetical protein